MQALEVFIVLIYRWLFLSYKYCFNKTASLTICSARETKFRQMYSKRGEFLCILLTPTDRTIYALAFKCMCACADKVDPVLDCVPVNFHRNVFSLTFLTKKIFFPIQFVSFRSHLYFL